MPDGTAGRRRRSPLLCSAADVFDDFNIAMRGIGLRADNPDLKRTKPEFTGLHFEQSGAGFMKTTINRAFSLDKDAHWRAGCIC